jgi:hypothetical protein
VDDAVAQAFAIRAPTPLGPDDCWPWQRTLATKGYGVFVVDRVQYRASRVALSLALGRDLTADEEACHRCDNPPCVNPLHLFAASKAENQHDKGRKGRAARGERNGGGGKLYDDDVRAIRRRIAAGETLAAIAADYEVSRALVGHIKHGRLWRHVE